MYTGRCLCGDVRFEIHGPIHDIVYCHCSRCRKAQGTAFATNGNVAIEDFRITTGKDLLTEYADSNVHSKFFCRRCGSPIMSTNKNSPDKIRIRLGTIESEISERPQAHIFVGSKANWDVIHDDIPQFEQAKI